MNKFLLKDKIMKIILALVVTLFIASCGGPKSTTITIQPNGNQMSYKTTQFTVEANQEVTLIMDNIATIPMMKHNVVILNDQSKAAEVGQLALSAEDYLPDHPAIIAATAMADIGEKTQTTFTAPSEAGVICTFACSLTLCNDARKMIVK